MFKGHSIWLAYLIVFVSSACTLVVELVAGRIMAPYIGVSLYTWTSIIGVVLAGISLGNYLGGRIADRWASRKTLAVVFVASGLASVAVLPTTAIAAANSTNIPLVPKIVLFTAFIFFAPSCLMGMTSPIVIKLTLADLHQTGNVVGKIYALSTLGSIFGTFITGFVLISWLGTRTIIWAVALTLIAMGIAAGFGRSRRHALAGPGVLLIYVAAFSQRAPFGAPCVRETNYFCINVFTTALPGIGEVKAMVLDHLVHSYISPDDPSKLGYGYERIYADITEYVAQREPGPLRTLFVGGGGYTFPRYVAAVYPTASVEVVEIDPGVTEVAYDFMGMPRDTKIKSYNEDGRLFFAGQNADDPYDLIYGDAFNDLSIPYHLTTVEFDRRVRARLEDDGFYLANVIDNPRTGQFLRAYLRTMREVFPYVYLFVEGTAAGWDQGGQSTLIVAATGRPLDFADLRRVVGQDGQRPLRSDMVTPEQIDDYLARGPAIVLSDDFAPVDQLVAPLFLERGY